MKNYMILGQSSPGEVLKYSGSFEPVPGQSDIITALAQEFANGDLVELNEWLGGNTDLADFAAAGNEYELWNDDCVFRVSISDAQ